FGRAGIPLSTIGRYRVVAWYTNNTSASGSENTPYLGNNPSTALRYMNADGHINILSLYLRQGGKLFLFGDGTVPAIGNGFWTRVGGQFFIPFLPYNSNPATPRQ